MGFLNLKDRILDVSLTDRGRELLSKNLLKFDSFAFSDEGIDYSGSLEYTKMPFLYSNAVSRVQAITTGSNGAGVKEITGSLTAQPKNGNTLIAVMGMQSIQTVSSIRQAGATWSRLTSSADATNNTECEVWWAPNVSSSVGTSVAIGISGFAQLIAVVAEYNGILAVDKSGSTVLDSPFPTGSTGLTPTTTEDFELWIGGMSSLVATAQTANTPGSTQIGFTGSSGLFTGMYEKFVRTKSPAEIMVGFSPDGTVIGCTTTFKVSSTKASGSAAIDDIVHRNLTYETDSRRDTDLKSYLYTSPQGSDILPSFVSNIDATKLYTLKRRFYMDEIVTVTTKRINAVKKPEAVIVKYTSKKEEKFRPTDFVVKQLSNFIKSEASTPQSIIGLPYSAGIVALNAKQALNLKTGAMISVANVEAEKFQTVVMKKEVEVIEGIDSQRVALSLKSGNKKVSAQNGFLIEVFLSESNGKLVRMPRHDVVDPLDEDDVFEEGFENFITFIES